MTTVTAETKLVLLNCGVVVGVQAQFARLLNNLLKGELGQGLGDPPRHLAFDVSLGVDDVDLLKLTASGFDVEEEAEDQTDEVEQCEEEIDTPWALSSEEGSEHDDGEVANPVCAGRRRRTNSTGTERVDLRGVDPGQRQQSKREEHDEEEDSNSSTLCVFLVLLD